MVKETQPSFEAVKKRAEKCISAFSAMFPDIQMDPIVNSKILEMRKMDDEKLLSSLNEYEYSEQLGRSKYAAEMIIVDITDAMEFFHEKMLEKRILSLYNNNSELN